ncbi:MAG: YidC/Oxa1 family membrane protein insertase [Clostridia bacterium]|nr:YidC/Oxa1 family membrane protein insertase [Clostridia bacterium]
MYISGNNFAIAIAIFTLVINLLLIPLTIKSQKSSVQQTKIKPKLDELKKKYGDDKQKYSAAMQELYQKENVSMAGGCLPMILRLVILMSIYYLVLSPVSYLTTVDNKQIDIATSAVVTEAETKSSRSEELALVTQITHDSLSLEGKKDKEIAAINEVKAEIEKIDFDFFGIDLTETPKFQFKLSAVQWNWIIPLLSFAMAMISSLISMQMQKSINPDAPNMKGMMLSMPLVSLIIAFSAPCGLGYYWACSSIISGGLQAGVQYFYGPFRMIAKERAKNFVKTSQLEQKTIDSTNSLGE